MDPKELQNFFKFFNNSRKLWNFNKFLSPAQNKWKYRKFLPTEKKISQFFLIAQNWQKFNKFLSPQIWENFISFGPRHKSRKFFQFFVPPVKLRDKISLTLKNVPHDSSVVGRPTLDKTLCTNRNGGRPPHVTKRAF